MSNKARAARRSLVGSIVEGSKDIPIIGFWTFWSVRNVDLTQEQLKAKLTANGLSDKYALEHNYRSAFTRALANMEEKRIIRRIEENERRIVIQFTAEEVVREAGDKELQYEKETILTVDKKIYFEEKDFAKALTSEGRPEIRRKVLNYFAEEKTKYNSGDITRYVQKILSDGADVISLRDQGCLYFVPAGSQEFLQKVVNLVRGLSSSTMEMVPMPDVKASRDLVGNAFVDEIDQTLERWEQEVEAVEKGDKEVGEKWGQTKIAKISEIVVRMRSYASLLNASEADRLEQSFKALEERVNPGRKLKLDNVEAEAEVEEEKLATALDER